jgi:NAD(P)-dependent dehydrogenase (short-subunit alcohol dehydrogenase family)
MALRDLKGRWALILGSSSGFGEACALELAQAGVNIFGVHLDRKATLDHVEDVVNQVKKLGSKVCFFNINAASEESRKEVLGKMKENVEGKPLAVLMHSLAFGTLKPFVDEGAKTSLSQKQMDMTLDVMAHSLVYWVQDLVWNNLLGKGSKVFAMTSAGGHSVWATYGAVSAAKAALESHVRQLAFELAPKEISVNALQAGVTDTPALRKIPGHEEMISLSKQRNPGNRLTTPNDVAQTMLAMASLENHWLTGNVIRVDGAEDIVG